MNRPFSWGYENDRIALMFQSFKFRVYISKGVCTMKNAKLIDCGNYFHESRFKLVCEALDKGETVKVHIDCIGHTQNEYEQENYKEALLEKYGDRLKHEKIKGAFSDSYIYKLA